MLGLRHRSDPHRFGGGKDLEGLRLRWARLHGEGLAGPGAADEKNGDAGEDADDGDEEVLAEGAVEGDAVLHGHVAAEVGLRLEEEPLHGPGGGEGPPPGEERTEGRKEGGRGGGGGWSEPTRSCFHFDEAGGTLTSGCFPFVALCFCFVVYLVPHRRLVLFLR